VKSLISYYITNSLPSVTVKLCWKSVGIWRNCGQEHDVTFLFTLANDPVFCSTMGKG